jgi:hypothetical protein
MLANGFYEVIAGRDILRALPDLARIGIDPSTCCTLFIADRNSTTFHANATEVQITFPLSLSSAMITLLNVLCINYLWIIIKDVE